MPYKKKDKKPTELKDIKKDSFGFNISNHLERIEKILSLLQEDLDMDTNPMSEMLEKIMSPDILKNLPLSDIVLSPEDLDDIDDVKCKITIMKGKQHGNEPMKIKKKVIQFGDNDKEKIKKVHKKSKDIIEAMLNSNVRTASNNDIKEYINSLKLAYKNVNKIVSHGDDERLVVQSLYYLNPSKFASMIDKNTLDIISGAISDISLCPPYTKENYQSIADRIKISYHSLLSDKNMVKSAYYITKKEGVPETGFNMCPKYKTVKGSKIPVPFDFCQRDCIEGKPEDDGSVSCKYAYWLEHVADSHAKVMEKLDVHRNPANKDMNLRLPDGQKSFAPRGYMKGIEQRIEEAGIRGRSWDDLKSASKIKSKASGKMLNYEALMDEILTDKDIHRTQEGSMENNEKKLENSRKNLNLNNTENRLYNKKEKSEPSIKDNIEFKISETRKENSFDKTKLLDELIEKAYPRKEETRPSGEK